MFIIVQRRGWEGLNTLCRALVAGVRGSFKFDRKCNKGVVCNFSIFDGVGCVCVCVCVYVRTHTHSVDYSLMQ